jgi:hypothetical protein
VRILLRASRHADLFGEYSTVAESFVAVGCQARLKPQTHYTARAWELARRTGSSRPGGEGAFTDDGLIVQEAGRGQRWLPRAQLEAYLEALRDDDAELLLLLTQPQEAAGAE